MRLCRVSVARAHAPTRLAIHSMMICEGSGSAWHDAHARGMILTFTTGRPRDCACVPFTLLFRQRNARLTVRDEAGYYRHLRLHAHPPRMLATAHSLARARAFRFGAPSSTRLHACRESVFLRFLSLRSLFSSAACGYRHHHLQGQLQRVRAAPPAARSAHAIAPPARPNTLFLAAVRTDRSFRRALFLLCSSPANDLWRSEHLLLEPRTMASRFWAAVGRACFRLLLLVCEWCLRGWSESARFAPWDLCEAC